ncbi:MAG: phosphodiester glycosidase family protein [Muribaculaceae bacterium]|nr:phosphodiester glycosidase family protein [Muribaculaceae bacterium]
MKLLVQFLSIGALALTSACSDSDTAAETSLMSPSNVVAEQLNETDVLLTWQDNATGEDGYIIVMRAADTPTFTEVGTVAANTESYTITSGIEQGKKYYLGVKAYNSAAQSRVISTLFDMQVLADLPGVTVSALNSGDNCIWGTYTLRNVAGLKVSYGLCWSATGIPTIDDAHLEGPAADASGNVFQVIPNAQLMYNLDYNVRAYLKTATDVYYSESATASMTKEYPAITLQWDKLASTGIPAEIEVYETTSTLNGDPFHAWYAIADVSGDVELRVNVPTAAATIDDQAAAFNGDCYVLINGGYFYNGRNTGLSVVDGVAAGAISDVRGSLITSDAEYNVLYPITRGVFGVDAAGKPSSFWAGTTGEAKPLYYTSPLATVKGENKYANPSQTLPQAPVTWNPKYALSAGPVLLADGKIPFNFTTTSKGADFYLTNYEVLPYDIFGSDVTPDRTAVGYLADGRVILFICDGRIAASGGATLLELAQVLKGLGCVGAVNFDGGGSTGMMVGDKHVNDVTPNNRPVVSTIGFFKKK